MVPPPPPTSVPPGIVVDSTFATDCLSLPGGVRTLRVRSHGEHTANPTHVVFAADTSGSTTARLGSASIRRIEAENVAAAAAVAATPPAIYCWGSSCTRVTTAHDIATTEGGGTAFCQAVEALRAGLHHVPEGADVLFVVTTDGQAWDHDAASLRFRELVEEHHKTFSVAVVGYGGKHREDQLCDVFRYDKGGVRFAGYRQVLDSAEGDAAGEFLASLVTEAQGSSVAHLGGLPLWGDVVLPVPTDGRPAHSPPFGGGGPCAVSSEAVEASAAAVRAGIAELGRRVHAGTGTAAELNAMYAALHACQQKAERAAEELVREQRERSEPPAAAHGDRAARIRALQAERASRLRKLRAEVRGGGRGPLASLAGPLHALRATLDALQKGSVARDTLRELLQTCTGTAKSAKLAARAADAAVDDGLGAAQRAARNAEAAPGLPCSHLFHSFLSLEDPSDIPESDVLVLIGTGGGERGPEALVRDCPVRALPFEVGTPVGCMTLEECVEAARSGSTFCERGPSGEPVTRIFGCIECGHPAAAARLAVPIVSLMVSGSDKYQVPQHKAIGALAHVATVLRLRGTREAEAKALTDSVRAMADACGSAERWRRAFASCASTSADWQSGEEMLFAALAYGGPAEVRAAHILALREGLASRSTVGLLRLLSCPSVVAEEPEPLASLEELVAPYDPASPYDSWVPPADAGPRTARVVAVLRLLHDGSRDLAAAVLHDVMRGEVGIEDVCLALHTKTNAVWRATIADGTWATPEDAASVRDEARAQVAAVYARSQREAFAAAERELGSKLLCLWIRFCEGDAVPIPCSDAVSRALFGDDSHYEKGARILPRSVYVTPGPLFGQRGEVLNVLGALHREWSSEPSRHVDFLARLAAAEGADKVDPSEVPPSMIRPDEPLSELARFAYSTAASVGKLDWVEQILPDKAEDDALRAEVDAAKATSDDPAGYRALLLRVSVPHLTWEQFRAAVEEVSGIGLDEPARTVLSDMGGEREAFLRAQWVCLSRAALHAWLHTWGHTPLDELAEVAAEKWGPSVASLLPDLLPRIREDDRSAMEACSKAWCETQGVGPEEPTKFFLSLCGHIAPVRL